jgi:hypothetical protein
MGLTRNCLRCKLNFSFFYMKLKYIYWIFISSFLYNNFELKKQYQMTKIYAKFFPIYLK